MRRGEKQWEQGKLLILRLSIMLNNRGIWQNLRQSRNHMASNSSPCIKHNPGVQ